MPSLNPEEFKALIISYLNGDDELKPLPKGKTFSDKSTEKRALFLSKLTTDAYNDSKQDEQSALLIAIDSAFQQIKLEISNNNADKKEDKKIDQKLIDKADRLKELKAKLCGDKYRNWKNALLKYNGQKWQDRHFDEIEIDPHADTPVPTINHFKPRHFAHSYTLVGSSFKTNEEFILKKSNQKTIHCLDALYATCDFDYKCRPTGISISIADGAGGHTEGEELDIHLGRAGHFATKHACRLLGAMKDPNDFDKNIQWLIKTIAAEIYLKTDNNRRHVGSTLIAAKAFVKGKRYLIKGFCVGDSMFAVWDPAKNMITTPAAAHLEIYEKLQAHASAIFPEQYKEYEIHPFSMEVQPGTVLLAFTDGIHDALPIRKSIHERNGGKFQEKILDAPAVQLLLKRLPPNPQPKDIVELLTSHALTTVEKLRIESKEKSQKAQEEKTKIEPQIKEQKEKLDAEKILVDAQLSELDKNKKETPKTEETNAYERQRAILLEKIADLRKRKDALQKPLLDLYNIIPFRIGDDFAILALTLPEVGQLVFNEQLPHAASTSSSNPASGPSITRK